MLTAQCARALADIHAIDWRGIEGLAPVDPLRDPLPFLDALGEVRPALEFGARWLATHRPPEGRRVTVHGDFRLGNLLVGPDGLRAVLDWELAHAGDPAEDLGWLCAPAWRFGGAGHVGGFGDVAVLLDAYAAAGGEVIDPERLRWWLVYATVKWATICAMQASSHLSGATRSVELAAIGRRVCESEWDLFTLLGLAPDPPPHDHPPGDVRGGTRATGEIDFAPFGRPTAAELVEAVREYVEGNVMETSEGRAHFQARIARNVLSVVERELQIGPAFSGITARAWRTSDSMATAPWRQPYGQVRVTATGPPSERRSPRPPATSCWWRIPPTCRRPARKPGAAPRRSRRSRGGPAPCGGCPAG